MMTNEAMYQRIRVAAERAGKKVELKGEPKRDFPEGVSVYVDGEWRAWFAALPSYHVEGERTAAEFLHDLGHG